MAILVWLEISNYEVIPIFLSEGCFGESVRNSPLGWSFLKHVLELGCLDHHLNDPGIIHSTLYFKNQLWWSAMTWKFIMPKNVLNYPEWFYRSAHLNIPRIRHYSIMISIKIPSNLPVLVKEKFNAAKAAGALIFSDTELAVIRANNIPASIFVHPGDDIWSQANCNL